MRLLEEEARRGRRERAGGLRLMPAALYAGLPAAAQLAALEPPPRGYRKVRVLCFRVSDAPVLLRRSTPAWPPPRSWPRWSHRCAATQG